MVILLLTIRLWSHHVNGQELLLLLLCLMWRSYFNWRKISLFVRQSDVKCGFHIVAILMAV